MHSTSLFTMSSVPLSATVQVMWYSFVQLTPEEAFISSVLCVGEQHLLLPQGSHTSATQVQFLRCKSYLKQTFAIELNKKRE